MSDQILYARAYLSRVAEPACIPLWDYVRRVGPVVAAAAIRDGSVRYDNLGQDVVAATAARAATADPGADLEAAERRGIRLVVPESPDWPHFAMACLERTGDARVASYREGNKKHEDYGEPIPPLALWVRGNGDLCTLAVRSVGIVGARASTSYGDQVAGELSYGLGARAFVVVSGGAYGIDAAAHRGALAAGAQTVLVSAGGLDRAYPPTHENLYRQVAETGLLISESPPGAGPHRHRFLTRNRIISALSTGSVVVESALRSGAKNTAGHCWRLGRPLMIVPGPVTSAMSAGNHALLRRPDGDVHLVTGVDDVAAVIGGAGEGLDPPRLDNVGTDVGTDAGTDGARAVLDDLDVAARQVYDGLPARRAISVTDLVQTSGLTASEVLAAVPVLMLHGLASTGPDGVQRVAPARPAR